MANGNGSGDLPEDQASHVVAVGATRQDEGFCTVGYKAPRLALPADRLRCRPSGILRATIHSAIRAPCGKDGAMKRAARHKTGSVVFDKRRKTWNFLWWEDGKRRCKAIGTVRQYPTKASAWSAAKAIQDSQEKQGKVVSRSPTVETLVEQYRVEKMPRRVMTRQGYNTWFNHYILPTWGDRTIQELEARPVDLWLQSLALAPKSKVHIRGLVRILWDF